MNNIGSIISLHCSIIDKSIIFSFTCSIIDNSISKKRWFEFRKSGIPKFNTQIPFQPIKYDIPSMKFSLHKSFGDNLSFLQKNCVSVVWLQKINLKILLCSQKVSEKITIFAKILCKNVWFFKQVWRIFLFTQRFSLENKTFCENQKYSPSFIVIFSIMFEPLKNVILASLIAINP